MARRRPEHGKRPWSGEFRALVAAVTLAGVAVAIASGASALDEFGWTAHAAETVTPAVAALGALAGIMVLVTVALAWANIVRDRVH